MKVALVHDDFVQEGGAEQLFAEIANLFPDAPIYTSLADWPKLPQSIHPDRVKTSFIQKFALSKKWYKLFLPLYPLAFESFDLQNFDLVISSTTRFAKGIITGPQTIHICYINSTPRFLWSKSQGDYLGGLTAVILKPLISWLQRWDLAASARVDHFIANSKNVAAKISKYYNRASDILYPFADLDFFTPAKIHNWLLKSQKYYLVVTRLVKWKKVDIAVKAAANLGVSLKIVGSGPDEGRLRKVSSRLAPPSAGQARTITPQVQFLGRVEKLELRDLYRNCQALIVTQEEDFGIAALEAQACGCPVIAFNAGGVTEIVKESQTGLFFDSQTPASLQDAISRSIRVKWSIAKCRQNAMRFGRERFVRELCQTIKTLK